MFQSNIDWEKRFDRLQLYKNEYTGIYRSIGGKRGEIAILSDYRSLLDVIGAITVNTKVGGGHDKAYYTRSPGDFYGISLIHENQLHEYAAHLSETYWLGNKFMELYLPDTYKNMIEYYSQIGFDFIY